MSPDNLAENLSPLKARALSLVDRFTQQATSVDDYLVDGIGNSLNSRLSIWLTHHPYVAWSFDHPLIALVAGLIIIILTVRLLLTIYNAIASTIDRMWLAILRSPVKFFRLCLKFLFGWQPKLEENTGTTITNYEITQDSQQIQHILARLDTIQQQQQQIIQELAELKQQPLTIQSPQLKKLSNK